MNNMLNPVHGDRSQSATASDCSESTSSQPQLKSFELSAQDIIK